MFKSLPAATSINFVLSGLPLFLETGQANATEQCGGHWSISKEMYRKWKLIMWEPFSVPSCEPERISKRGDLKAVNSSLSVLLNNPVPKPTDRADQGIFSVPSRWASWEEGWGGSGRMLQPRWGEGRVLKPERGEEDVYTGDREGSGSDEQ